MDHAIISRDTIRDRAREAFIKGRGRDDHNMNPTAPAVDDWQAEWDRCNAALRQMKVVRGLVGKLVSPP